MSNDPRPSGERPSRTTFRGKDLRGVDLRGADLRGADFTASNLQGVDLSAIRTGRPPWQTACLGVVGLFVSVSFGIAAGVTGAFVRTILDRPDPRYRAAAWVAAAEVVAFLGVLIWKGTRVALRTVVLFAVAAAAFAGLLGLATGTGTGMAAAGALLVIALSLLIMAMGTAARAMAGTATSWLFYLAAVGGALAARQAGGGLVVAAMAFAAALIGRRALKGDRRYPLIVEWANRFSCLGGTRFSGADLTGASLRGAKLKNADFRGAKIEPAQLKDAEQVTLCVFDR